MPVNKIIQELNKNKTVFEALLKNTHKTCYLWKPQADKWCLLEITCHLLDEEKEDFGARVKHVLKTPKQPMKPIDPEGWVIQRKYLEQDFHIMLAQFLEERTNSIQWLRNLKDPQWDNFYPHPKFGNLSAKMFLANWLAHDYLHFRQITRLKFQYLEAFSGENLNYAGGW